MAKASARMVAANLRMVACACAVVLLFARRGRAAREFVLSTRAAAAAGAQEARAGAGEAAWPAGLGCGTPARAILGPGAVAARA